MNFKQWYAQYDPKFVPTSEKIAADAWEACKSEIIRLIKENGGGIDYSLFEEIKDL